MTFTIPEQGIKGISFGNNDYFSAPISHGLHFAMMAKDAGVIAVDSEASKSLFRRRGMIRSQVPLSGIHVYMASEEAIPVLGKGTVGGIPSCLHVPQLDKDLLSVFHIDVELGWHVQFGRVVGVVLDSCGKELLRGHLDPNPKIVLDMINVDAIIDQRCHEDDILEAGAREVALAVMTKSNYAYRLHTFHSGSRWLEGIVKSGVLAWPLDPAEVKPVGFKKVLLPCDACGIGKATRATFDGKVMTDFTVCSVWQIDISSNRPIPSLQGNVYTIGYLERISKKLFDYFSKTEEVLGKTKVTLESEILKCRLRH